MSTPNASSAEFDRFRDLTRRLLAVPKSAVPKHVPTKRAKSAPRKRIKPQV